MLNHVEGVRKDRCQNERWALTAANKTEQMKPVREMQIKPQNNGCLFICDGAVERYSYLY